VIRVLSAEDEKRLKILENERKKLQRDLDYLFSTLMELNDKLYDDLSGQPINSRKYDLMKEQYYLLRTYELVVRERINLNYEEITAITKKENQNEN